MPLLPPSTLDSQKRLGPALLVLLGTLALLVACVKGKAKPSSDAAAQPARTEAAALVLPLSGPYGSIGSRILVGVRLAQDVLARQGHALQLDVIDSTDPAIAERLTALPANRVLVGGPLRAQVFATLRATASLRGRAVFAFMPDLDQGAVEGRDAWRLFASPQDQVRTVLLAAMADFGVDRFAALLPDEPYGERMGRFFEQEAAAHNATLVRQAIYPPARPLDWSSVAAGLLGKARGGLNADPGFRAVYLPDVWSQVEMLIPNFFLLKEDRMLLLGSSLWGQTFGGEMRLPPRSRRLALFPGAWWSGNPSPAAQELLEGLGRQPSAPADAQWEALGFDFVRLAARLGQLPPDWTPKLVNQRLQAAQSMDWAMAPITWDASGLAAQKLFLFTPTPNGPAPADIPAMRERFRLTDQLRQRLAAPAAP